MCVFIFLVLFRPSRSLTHVKWFHFSGIQEFFQSNSIAARVLSLALSPLHWRDIFHPPPRLDARNVRRQEGGGERKMYSECVDLCQTRQHTGDTGVGWFVVEVLRK